MAAAIIVSMTVFAESASAHGQTATKKVVSARATKGVRTTTAYQKPRSRGTSKASVVRANVSLPPEQSGDGTAGDIRNRALSLVGARYRWGGTSKATGFDCSGLIKYLLGAKSNSLPRTSTGMYRSVTKAGEMRPGDLVFFGRGRVSHVGVYIGNDQFVHASTPRAGVRTDSVSQLARSLGFMGVGRI